LAEAYGFTQTLLTLAGRSKETEKDE